MKKLVLLPIIICICLFGNSLLASTETSDPERIDKALIGSTSNQLSDTAQATAYSKEAFKNYEKAKYAEAIKLETEALKIRERVLGNQHPDYAKSLSKLAYYAWSLGNYTDEAMRMEMMAMEIRERVLGKSHPDYAESLSNLATYNWSIGNYSEAIRLGTEALNIQERVFGKEHLECATSLGNLASYNSSNGNYAEAINLASEALKIRERVSGKDHQYYAILLSNLANYNSLIGNYKEAVRLGTEALKIYERIFGIEHLYYAKMLDGLAVYNSYLGNYTESLKLGTEILKIYERVLGKEHPDYAASLSNLANYNWLLGNYSVSLKLGTEALKIRERVLGKDHPYYAESLNSLATYNSLLGNYAEAIRLGTEVLEIQKRVLGKEHSSYVISLSNLASYKSLNGNYAEAIKLEIEALKIRERVLGKDHPYYATSLNNLANYNSYIGNYIEAVRLVTEALNIRERVLGKEHRDYATSLSNLASYNSLSGNYTEAIRSGTEALEIIASVLGKDHPDYATLLNNLAYYNSDLGNYTEAIRLETNVLRIQERVLGKEHPDYATSLSNLAHYNWLLGNYSESLKLGTEALTIRERILGKAHPDYASSLNSLAGYNSALGNNTEAVRLVTEALKIRERVLGKDHPDYASSLDNLASYNSYLGNYTEEERLVTEALKIRERVLGKDHPDYASSLNNLASYNLRIGNYTESVVLRKEALKIQDKAFGKEHPDYILSLMNLACNYFVMRNVQVERYVREATEGNMAFIRKMFGGMTGYERANFWGMKESWFNFGLPNFAYGMGTDTLVECAVNGALMSKGLLLNSEIEMTRLLQESGDEAALEKYQELRLNRLQLNKLYEKPIAERPLDADSLEAVVDRLERELVAMSKAYGDYTRNLVIDWRQVQAELGERDAAVEFVRFAVMESDSVMYAAYVTRPGYAVPRMIPLFEARQLEALADFEYEDERLSELVWKPLAEVLSGVERVYFAPAGELYNMAIESAPDWEDPERLMSDRRELYRLSSTRELAVTYDDSTAASASVYGGIDYDRVERGKSKDESGRETQLSIEEASAGGKRAWLADSLGLRAGVESLPGTRVEAEAVDRSLRGRRVASELLTDSLGSEWSIKALSGRRKGLLHIATHGFYYSEEEIQEMGSRSFLRLDGMQGARYVEDKALTRSGLLMAGANNALKGEAPEGENDGILTAKEISQLDLRGMDLVVLSACQTGLGEVTGDGVFGLQRGFKKAGARSLLMSLWKVDDKATQLLMERFYDNLTAGMSKHEALLDAQRYVREYEVSIDTKSGRRETTNGRRMALPVGLKMHPYSNPKYWAGFVLLDGE